MIATVARHRGQQLSIMVLGNDTVNILLRVELDTPREVKSQSIECRASVAIGRTVSRE